MILFGSSFSPYVRKVLVVAAEKGIELEVRPVGVGDRDEQFRAASPLGKMPALADGGLATARRRWRRAWFGSFRVRLAVALFAFFAAPTSAFAVWSYRQIQAGDREALVASAEPVAGRHRGAVVEQWLVADDDGLTGVAVHDHRERTLGLAPQQLGDCLPFGDAHDLSRRRRLRR